VAATARIQNHPKCDGCDGAVEPDERLPLPIGRSNSARDHLVDTGAAQKAANDALGETGDKPAHKQNDEGSNEVQSLGQERWLHRQLNGGNQGRSAAMDPNNESGRHPKHDGDPISKAAHQ